MSLERNKRLAKDIAIYSVGIIGSKFLAFLLFPVLTFFAAREEFGYYDIALEVVLFILPLSTLVMRESTFRLLIDSNDETYKKHILSTTLFIEVVVFIIILIIASILPFLFTIRYLTLIILSIYIYSLYEIYIQAVRSVYSSTHFVLINLITSFFTLTFVFLFYFVLKRGLIEALFVGNILSRTLGMLIIELPRRRITGCLSLSAVTKKYIKEIFNYSLPLLGTAIAFAIITSTGKFVVNYLYGNEYSGILGASQKYMVVLLILGTAFYQAWQVTAVKHFKAQGSEKFFSEVFNKYAVTLGLLVLIISFGLRSFKGLLIGSAYHQSIDLIFVYCISSVFFCLSLFFEVIYQCTKQTSKILYSIVSCAAFAPLLTFVLTKYFGLMGNLAALSIAYIYMFIFRLIQTRSTMMIRLNKSFLFLFSGLLIGGFFFYYTQNKAIDYVILCIAIVLLCYFLLTSRKYFFKKKET